MAETEQKEQQKLRLDADNLPPTQRRLRRRRPSRWRKRLSAVMKPRRIAVSLLVAITVLVGGQVVLLTDAANQLQNSLENFERVLRSLGTQNGTDLTLADFDRLESSLGDLGRSVRLAQQRAVLLRPLARLNPNWAAYIGVLDTSDQLITASRSMLSGIEPTLFFLVQGEQDEVALSQASSGERIVELLTVGRGRFLSAQSQLEAAAGHLNAINVADTTASTLLLVEEISTYYDSLADVNEVLLGLPDILTVTFGLEGEANYLILAQNNDEIRPSGGFIGTWGWMTVRNGRITDFAYSASTPTSPRPPSGPLPARYAIPDWWLRFEQPLFAAWDGSWHTSFPDTAEMAAWYYNNGDNPQTPVDGVIAIDITGFEYMLGALERVSVPAYEVIVTQDNFREVVYDVRESREHKAFVADVYRAIFNDWNRLNRDPSRSRALFGATLQALRERHLVVYMADEDIQSALTLLGWDGAQQTAQGHDYLMVADANVSPNKSNNSVIRQWTYDVVIQPDGSLQSRASVGYDYPQAIAREDPAVNPAYHGPLNYRNLLQVVVPPGSQATGNSAEQDVRLIDVVQTPDFTRFVSIFTVEYDTAERVQFAYNTPPLIETFGTYRRYRLLLQKQPGARSEQVTVQITLPPGAQLVSTSPDFATSYTLEQLVLDYRITLTTDQWIEIIFQ